MNVQFDEHFGFSDREVEEMLAIEELFSAYLAKTINIRDTGVRSKKKENFSNFNLEPSVKRLSSLKNQSKKEDKIDKVDKAGNKILKMEEDQFK